MYIYRHKDYIETGSESLNSHLSSISNIREIDKGNSKISVTALVSFI